MAKSLNWFQIAMTTDESQWVVSGRNLSCVILDQPSLAGLGISTCLSFSVLLDKSWRPVDQSCTISCFGSKHCGFCLEGSHTRLGQHPPRCSGVFCSILPCQWTGFSPEQGPCGRDKGPACRNVGLVGVVQGLRCDKLVKLAICNEKFQSAKGLVATHMP